MALTVTALLARMTACAPQHHGDYTRLTFPAMGTQNTLLFRAPSAVTAREFLAEALRWLADFEVRFSRFIPTSLVSRLNAGAGNGAWLELDAEAQELFALCDWFHWKTGGVFDPTVGTAEQLWNLRQQPLHVPSHDEIMALLTRIGWHNVERAKGRARLTRAGLALDLGGIGKEYAVDHVFALAQRRGIRDVLVDFGRDLRVGGSPPEGGDWRLGLEHPAQPDACWGGVALTDAALCCSGDYRRYVEVAGRHYAHLMDPRTGRPAQSGVHAAWSIAPTCTEAGILTTVACILGVAEGSKLFEQTPGAAGCIWADQGLFQTRRFQKYEIKNVA
ncbi:MAG: FAD:protein FMN transferase [Verrucomicrobia bacterium]|nr:MAG: FAD:protein FMN transferase [Verrucomicrobiota bacterium]